MKRDSFKFFILLFVAAIVVYTVGILKVKSIIWGDSLYYYAYTRSIVIDRDINFTNEAYRPNIGFPHTPEISELTGKITNKYSPGTALAWIPGMLAGQIFSYCANFILGENTVSTDGYGTVTQYIVGVSAIAYSVLGLWFVYKTLSIFFSKKTSVYSVLFLFFTSALFYYTAVDPLNSHSISFFLSAVIWYQFAQLQSKKITWQRVIPLGLLAGALVLVRNQDVVVTLPLILYLVLSRKESLMNKLNWFTLFVGSAFLVASIQLFTTLELFGVLGSPYLMRGETLSWLSPDFLRVLFSFENGLFAFSPGLLVATIYLGLYTFTTQLQKNKQTQALFTVSGVAFLIFILQLYVIASWAPEIVGGPYGSRMFISILPHLAVGVALMIRQVRNKYHAYFFILYAVFLIALTANMLGQTMYMLYRF